jgi:hypothetical protein
MSPPQSCCERLQTQPDELLEIYGVEIVDAALHGQLKCALFPHCFRVVLPRESNCPAHGEVKPWRSRSG